MKSDQQLIQEGERIDRARDGREPSGIKTILLHVVDDGFDDRFESALSLARACSAHLSCVHVTPVEAYVAFDSFGGVFVMNDIIKALDERDDKLAKRVEKRLRNEDVSWDYEQVTGDVASSLLSRAALADLVVTARDPAHNDLVRSAIGFLGDLLHRSRTPLFIPAFPYSVVDPTGVAVIAWNSSFEAANAVRGALGLLRLASEVRIVQVTEAREQSGAFPGTKLIKYLSRQGIHAELAVEASPTGDVGHEVVAGMIVSQAQGAGAAYLVMGGYSHTRIGEYVFGGVTRTLLKDCPVPLVIAH